MRNDIAERFNGRMRNEGRDKTLFPDLAHAPVVNVAWAADGNHGRPHAALGYQRPAA